MGGIRFIIKRIPSIALPRQKPFLQILLASLRLAKRICKTVAASGGKGFTKMPMAGMRNAVFALTGLFALLISPLQAQTLPAWAEGRWKVSRPSENFRGEKVLFSKDSFAMFFNVAGDPEYPFRVEPTTCPEPLYESDWESSSEFFTTNRQDFSQLTGVRTDSIPVLRVFCVDPKTGAQVYFVKKKRLLLTYLGLVCYLRPARK